MNISLKNLTKVYKGNTKAIKDMTYELSGPGLIGLLGPNGAGKTTLMSLIVGEILPTEGQITVDGMPFSKKEKQFKRKLGYLPQYFGLYEELSVYEFLDYISALKEITKSKQAIDKVIEQTHLEAEKNKCIGRLSGGQKQRVGIAQALLGSPELLILDEPTVGLDPEERIKFRELLKGLSQNVLIVLSTHIIEDVENTCENLVIINEGILSFQGSPVYFIEEMGYDPLEKNALEKAYVECIRGGHKQ